MHTIPPAGLRAANPAASFVRFPRVLGIECVGEVVSACVVMSEDLQQAHANMDANRANGKTVIVAP